MEDGVPQSPTVRTARPTCGWGLHRAGCFPTQPCWSARPGGASLGFQGSCGPGVTTTRVCSLTETKDPDLGVNFRGDSGDQSDVWKKGQNGWGTCWRAHWVWGPLVCCVWGLRSGQHLGLSLGESLDSALVFDNCVFSDFTYASREDSKKAVTS